MRRTMSRLGPIALMALLAVAACAQNHSESADNKNGSVRPTGGGAPSTAIRGDEQDAGTQPPTPATDGGLNPLAGQGAAGSTATSSWLNEPKAIALIGIIAFLGLALHIVHLLTESRSKRELAHLHGAVQLLSQRASMPQQPDNRGRTASPDELEQRLNRHRHGLDHLSSQVNQLDDRVTANERRSTEAATAVALAAHMAGAPRIRQALDQDRRGMADEDRSAAIQIVERFEGILGANAAKVKPLTLEMAALAKRLGEQPNRSSEVEDRVRGLLRDLVQFENWHANATERLGSLQRGSAAGRSSAFSTEQSALVEQLNAGTISIVDYVKGYRDLMEIHFPPVQNNGQDSIAPEEHESELKELTAAVPDYVMNWFDRFFQLQSQAAQASIDAQTAAELSQIQGTARDVLGKFDIQPDEIQIGLTTFDRRLHDAALITQSSQFSANSVIGVQQCGFRKLSTGDVLRRPKVTVAGVGAV